MTIVLGILKIIGILLLVILGLLILILTGILFVPVRYRITGELTEEVHLRIQLNWLLHLIRFRSLWDGNETRKEFKILGIPIGKKKEKPPKTKKKNQRKKKQKASRKSKPVAVTKKQEVKENIINESISDENTLENTRENITQADTLKATNTENHTSKASATSKKHTKRQKNTFFSKIKAFPKSIQAKWKAFKEKLADIRDIILRIKTEIQDEYNRGALKIVFRELKYLLKHISPRKAKGSIAFGMEDPASTGQILGILSMIPFIYRYNINIQPDFETEQFYGRGNFDIKGHIRIIHILAAGYRLFKDAHIKHIIQRYRNS